MTALVAKYNVLDFYTDKSNRRWDNTTNPEQFLLFFDKGRIPAIQLIIDSATPASIQVFDIEDNPVVGAQPMSLETTTAYSRLIYLGTTLAGTTDGYYYLKVVAGGLTLYSEVFGWISDTSELLKIEVTDMANYNLGGIYVNNMAGFTHSCYLDAEYSGMSPKIDEEAEENNGVTDTTYGSRTIVRKFVFPAHEYVYGFISGLRILSANGTVTFTYQGRQFSAVDIDVTTEEDLVAGDIYEISIEFKVRNEGLSTNNVVFN